MENLHIVYNSLLKSLDEVVDIMKYNKGIQHVITERLSFEKWFQVELLNRLLLNDDMNTYSIEDSKILNGTSKRQSIDLTVNGKIGIELKIITTNYEVDNKIVKKRIKNISDNFYSLISDFNRMSELENQFGISFIYPFPIDKKHKNYKDFEKQLNKINSKYYIKFTNYSSEYNSLIFVLHNIDSIEIYSEYPLNNNMNLIKL